MNMKKLLGVTLLFTAACGASEDDAVAPLAAMGPAIATNYANIVVQSYADSLALVTDGGGLVQLVAAFVSAPSEQNLADARKAWLAAREPYLQTEVYRFYDGPIDHPETGPEGMINAWPMDEAYVDYVEGKPDAGLVNDVSLPINEDALISRNEVGGEQNIATGFHAIEFLLWGQDQSATGPGARPWQDFLTTAEATHPNGERRAAYLTTATTLLSEHLATLVDAWAADGDNYRTEFLAAGPEEALRRILTGMIVLSGFETGGERLQPALDSGSQEDEHSCFSDNTHRDMIQDIVGIQNVWQGKYTATDGVVIEGESVRALVAELDRELAVKLDVALEEALSLAQALVPPFDQEIALANTEGRARVAALIVAMRAQEKLLVEVFRLLGLSVPVLE